MWRLVLVLLAFGAMPALAQEQEQEQEEIVGVERKCWLGSMSYSPGATARAGDGVMLCTTNFVWEATTDRASGCSLEGRFYGIGAIPNASSSQRILSECQPDGTWRRIEAVN